MTLSGMAYAWRDYIKQPCWLTPMSHQQLDAMPVHPPSANAWMNTLVAGSIPAPAKAG
ncbi:hypothetical protein OVA24_01760 [Luteolibacter sp. SL250]|uniref:hypothetical protein n=1 Tax=Luteolibacter sp. SL250 TaxID=2995170 RepID=UPI00226E026D|nr:hypothetical protein [Luteolibacter sp. SL250]WAC20103.1 hypothetical protein OVA24_01760 [Luteolibacter sp. SL250]